MKTIFILIRGNSGSGKTVLADNLQKYLGYDNCFLPHQDVIRRDILHANDRRGTPAISLIKELVEYGSKHYQVIILEGILRKDVYGEMLENLLKLFGHNAFVYYLDVPFSLTVEHNQTKDSPFPIASLKKWWRANDYLEYNDRRLSNGDTKTFFKQIIQDITENNL